MTNIQESFAQWFKNKTAKKKKKATQDEDSDSDTESQKKNDSRSHRGEKRAPVYKQRAFETIPAPPMVEVDDSDIVILDFDEEFETPTQESLVSAKYFNGMNANGEKCQISPFQYPYIKHLLTTPQKVVHREDVFTKLKPNVEVVCRAHEEKYLCEPDFSKGEKSCARGIECEGLKIHEAGDHAFVLKEYFTPNQEQAKVSSEDAKLCIMCLRFLIHQCVLEIKADGEYLHDDMIMQSFGNIVGLPGEYTIESVVCSDKDTYEGLVIPLVEHKRTAYTIEIRTVNGKPVRYYIQSNMPYPPANHFQ